MIDLFGRKIAIVNAADPTLVGMKGIVMLESMQMLQLETANGTRSIQKRGSVLKVEGTNDLVICDSLLGRLEDRLGRRTRR